MTRLVSTILMAAAVLAGVWYLPEFYFQCAVFLMIALGLWEYSKLVFQDIPTRLFTLLLGLFVAGAVNFFGTGVGVDLDFATFYFFLPALVLFFSFLWEMWRKGPIHEMVHRAGLIFLGVCYLGLTLPFWSWIRTAGNEFVFLFLFPTLLTDTFGFLGGKTFGRHKIAPVISPQKTWEGFFGSLLGGGIFGFWLALQLFFKNKMAVEWTGIVVIGISISLVAIFGDLIESLIKRSVGVKDSSHLIPGHGGALDRLDALIFVAPFSYCLMKLFWFLPFP